ncbi:MAG: hypothetical protein CMO01_14335 [Thalassobius sp.]|nr:hypothetical protein [Thalassovita sp.]
MKEFFLHKYKDYSLSQLNDIVVRDKTYEASAVEAAKDLLKEKKEAYQSGLEVPVNPTYYKAVEIKDSDFTESLNYKPYFRTYSYRDFTTAFSLANLCVAIYEFLIYCSDESILGNNRGLLIIVVYNIAVLLNHSTYKLEHKRSNNYIGRSIHTITFTAIFLTEMLLYRYLVYSRVLDAGVVFYILLVFGVLFLEFIVSILKHILNLLKCPIF